VEAAHNVQHDAVALAVPAQLLVVHQRRPQVAALHDLTGNPGFRVQGLDPTLQVQVLFQLACRVYMRSYIPAPPALHDLTRSAGATRESDASHVHHACVSSQRAASDGAAVTSMLSRLGAAASRAQICCRGQPSARHKLQSALVHTNSPVRAADSGRTSVRTMGSCPGGM